MTDTNPAKFKKLVTLLRELFQLDQPDLDFGIYRIMHAKAGEVTQFLERDLLPQVKEAFSSYQSADSGELKKTLAEKEAQYRADGIDPSTVPGILKLREQLKGAVDIGALENETYDHLFSFFRRYYSEGDFLAKRVYKPGVYAIPYEGEEVTLHWANKDQYYIKTSEYLRDYAFRLRPEAQDGQDPMRVHFKLVDAAEGEHGNVKAAEGSNRVFVLATEDFIALEDGELSLRFEYRPATLHDWPAAQRDSQKKPPSQKDLIDIAEARIAGAGAAFEAWLAELSIQHVKADGEAADYSRLKAHLRRYSARNTFDYFIHKDLGGFLRRELDFYIKNEVMHLDDVENETVPKVEQYLSKIKVIRRIGGKVIDFLAQIENFQKKLWLKKKFVTEATWLVALSQVPEELLAEICSNAAQRDEWVALHGINTMMGDTVTPGYSVPLTESFLKVHPTLMVDTHWFDADFAERLLSAFEDADSSTDGVLVHSENFQALGLIKARFREQVKCIYIDPPYNTGGDGFTYKDNYKSSTWLSMFQDRLAASADLLQTDDAFFAISIDKRQMFDGKLVASSVLSGMEFVNAIVNVSNPKGRSDQKHLPTAHDNILLFASDGAISRGWRPQDKVLRRYRLQDELGRYREIDLRKTGDNDLASDRPKMSYAFAYNEATQSLVPLELGETKCPEGFFLIWPMKDSETSGCWRWGVSTAKANVNRLVGKFQPQKSQWTVFEKDRLDDDERVFPTSVWDEKPFNSERGSGQLASLGLGDDFSRPKPAGLLEHLLEHIGGHLTLDFFAGSGTTAHAIINMNRSDNGRRRFILAEMGDYFDSVTLPRIKKVTFTPEWKDGSPKRLAEVVEAERGPRLIKVLRLESYEDTLNNLDLRRTTQQQGTLDLAAAKGADGLREQYLLRYQLNVESRGNQSLLNIAAFTDPTAYKLNVKAPGSDESREVNVDLLETFNWLLGLTVQHITAPRSFTTEFERDDQGRLQLKGRLKQDATGPWWFRTVTGTTPEGRKTLVIWRKLTGDAEQDNLVLDTWFKDKQAYSVRATEFDLIFVNGDNTLENLRVDPETWKVRLIEEDFQRLMFDGTEV